MKMYTDYNKKRFQMEELQAFVLFLNEGMKAVERMFPQHKAFVEANKSKSYQEVKHELLTEQHAA